MDHYCRGCGLECAWSAISDGVYCNPCRAKSGLPALPRKHGPGGSGLSGPCDADCRKCAVERAPLAEMPVRCGRCHNDPCTCPPPQTDKTWLPTTTGTSTSTTTIIRYVRATKASSSADPLDVWYDGVPLRTLLEDDKLRRLDNAAAMARCRCNTSAQRAAVSAHWSADLRAKVTASRSAERNQVVLEQDAEDFEW